MRLGATLAHLSPAPPQPIASLGERLVDAGFESLWVPQMIGRGYLVPDPFVTLAVAATATEGRGAGNGHRAGPAAPSRRPRPPDSVAAARVRRPADAGRQPRVDRHRLRHLRPGLRRALPDLRRRTWRGCACCSPTGGTSAPTSPRPTCSRGGRRCCSAPGAPTSSGPPGSSTAGSPPATAGRRTQIIAAHERYRAAGGRRAIVCAIRLAADDDLGPTGEHAAAIRGGRLRRRRCPDRTRRTGPRTGQGASAVSPREPAPGGSGRSGYRHAAAQNGLSRASGSWPSKPFWLSTIVRPSVVESTMVV